MAMKRQTGKKSVTIKVTKNPTVGSVKAGALPKPRPMMKSCCR